MSDNSAIEWTDATYNPVTGCEKVSPGCDNCYALTFSERWRGTPGHYFENGFDIQLRPDKLDLPLTWKKPRKVFVNSMSDLFHKDIPDEYIAKVFAVMGATPQHTYQLLTKRHGRMRSLLASPAFSEMLDREFLDLTVNQHPELAQTSWQYPLPNVWLGVSVEDQKRADLRIPALLETPAAIRFLSCEPLLGPVDLWGPVTQRGDRPKLTYWLDGRPTPGPEYTTSTGLTMHSPAIVTGPRIDWVIVGGESGRGARPMDTAWATQIVQQCQHANVPAFVKQLGSRWGKQHKEIDQFPADLRIRQFPETAR